ncbi:uncharacterized protein LOC134272067 [Saccostrea cucullata]|uniref:uncharacterized protein LOC134272067 n=1 Tax=Saccostrea cuccullata TaxID=36930 RepID=UPI002ED37C11
MGTCLDFDQFHPLKCHIKDLLNELMLGSMPGTVLVFAIVRLRLCLCKGNASKLVSRSSAICMYIACVLSSVVLQALLLSPEFFLDKNIILQDVIVTHFDNMSASSSDICYKFLSNIHSAVLFYKWINIIFCFVLPLLVSVAIYLKISLYVYKSANRVHMHSVNPPQNTTRNVLGPNLQQIHRSLIWVVFVMVVCWAPLITTQIVMLLPAESRFAYAFQEYSALILLVLFPVEEGIMQGDKRKRLYKLYRQLFFKSQQQNIQTTDRCNDAILIPTLSQRVSTCIFSCSLEEDGIRKSSDVKILNLNMTHLAGKTVTCRELASTTSVHSFSYSSSSSLFSRRRGLMVPSLKLSADLRSERSSVFIISKPGSRTSIEQSSVFSSSSETFTPLFLRLNRDINSMIGEYTQDLALETLDCSPYSLRTVSFSSSVSFDEQTLASNDRFSASRTRSRWTPFSRSLSSAAKYSESDDTV